jgi:hypothetical protein
MPRPRIWATKESSRPYHAIFARICVASQHQSSKRHESVAGAVRSGVILDMKHHGLKSALDCSDKTVHHQDEAGRADCKKDEGAYLGGFCARARAARPPRMRDGVRAHTRSHSCDARLLCLRASVCASAPMCDGACARAGEVVDRSRAKMVVMVGGCVEERRFFLRKLESLNFQWVAPYLVGHGGCDNPAGGRLWWSCRRLAGHGDIEPLFWNRIAKSLVRWIACGRKMMSSGKEPRPLRKRHARAVML